MLRFAFIRKNKTLLSIFRQKQVLDVLRQNYQSVCSAKKKVCFVFMNKFVFK